jgi:uncharacterized protein (DUF302 family)
VQAARRDQFSEAIDRFGNREVAGKMQDRQTAGIDLPVKALAWEDADGRVWLGYNDAAWIAQRHGLGADSRKAIEVMAAGLAALTKAAATR